MFCPFTLSLPSTGLEGCFSSKCVISAHKVHILVVKDYTARNAQVVALRNLAVAVYSHQADIRIFASSVASCQQP